MSEGTPQLSVVVPARNEATHLSASLSSVLEALAVAGVPAELLVVDGMSTDGTRDLIAGIAARNHTVRLLDNPARITPAAFNRGIAASRGRFIAIVSAHSAVDLQFFANALRRLEQQDGDVIGGPVTTVPGGPGAFAWLLARLVSHPFGVGNSRFRVSTREAYVDAVPFAVFRREVFDRIGLFDESLVRNQDTDFFGRVSRAGIRVLLDPAVRSTYFARATLPGLLTQGFRNAYWNVRVWRRNPGAFQARHAIPGILSITLTGLLLTGFIWRGAWWVLWLALAAYALAAVAASIHLAWRTRRLLPLILPPVFFLYHYVYGLGSLAGLRWLVAPPPPTRPST